jgi:hypothetical protein
LKRDGDAEADEHDRGATHHVDQEVVGRDDDRDRHRERRDDGDDTRRQPRRGGKEHDPDEQVPAHVQAREGRVLVRQPRRLQRAVGVRLLGDGVDELERQQPRRGDGEEREEEEAERARHEERVAEQHVPPPVAEVEDDGGRQDHRPVAPDVDPVGERHQHVAAGERRLERLLSSDADRPLEVEQPLGVGERRLGAARRQVADAEVQEDRERDERRLAEKATAGARDERRAQANSNPGRGGRHESHLLTARIARASGGRVGADADRGRETPRGLGARL